MLHVVVLTYRSASLSAGKLNSVLDLGDFVPSQPPNCKVGCIYSVAT